MNVGIFRNRAALEFMNKIKRFQNTVLRTWNRNECRLFLQPRPLQPCIPLSQIGPMQCTSKILSATVAKPTSFQIFFDLEYKSAKD